MTTIDIEMQVETVASHTAPRQDQSPLSDGKARYLDGKEAVGFSSVPSWLIALVALPNNPITLVHVGLFAAISTWSGPGRPPFPSIFTIANRTGYGKTQIHKLIKELEKVGALRRNARYRQNGSGRTSNEYILATIKGPLDDDSVSGERTYGASAGPHEFAGPNSHAFGPAKPNQLKSEPDPEEKRVLHRRSLKTANSDAGVFENVIEVSSEEKRLQIAWRALEAELKTNFPYMKASQLEYRLGSVLQLVYEEAEIDEAPYALAAIQRRMEARRWSVSVGLSEPLHEPSAVAGFARNVLDSWGADCIWEGFFAEDMTAVWDSYVDLVSERGRLGDWLYPDAEVETE
jgi:hypothetical protein